MNGKLSITDDGRLNYRGYSSLKRAVLESLNEKGECTIFELIEDVRHKHIEFKYLRPLEYCKVIAESIRYDEVTSTYQGQ